METPFSLISEATTTAPRDQVISKWLERAGNGKQGEGLGRENIGAGERLVKDGEERSREREGKGRSR